MDKTAYDREFIEQYAGFVHSIAQKTRAQLGLDCDVNDLVAYGYQGLLEARERFDPARSVQFSSFAYYRVRGAVIDGVRLMSYMPRRAYARLLAAEAADREGESETEASAARGTASNRESSLRAIDGILGRIAAAYTTAAAREVEDDPCSVSPEQELIQRESRARIERALARLPEQERDLVRGHYLEGRAFNDMAAELGVSKSWVSRMHTSALNRMRKYLAAE